MANDRRLKATKSGIVMDIVDRTPRPCRDVDSRAEAILRGLGLTVGFVVAGAAAGAVAGLLSLTPLWLGLTLLPRDFIQGWGLVIIATVGAICGGVVMPVYGWLLIGRVGFWRCVLAVLIGAVLGENLAVPVFWSMESDVLIVGAFVGASIATLGIRLLVKKRPMIVAAQA